MSVLGTPQLEGKLFQPSGVLREVEHARAAEYGHRLAAIVESSDDAIISIDLNGAITSWNPGAERLYGYTKEEIIGRSVAILIPPDRRDEEFGILERIRRGERVGHYETVRRRKDGGLVDISLTVSPLKNAEGEITGASKLARDISERKRAHEHRKLLVNEMEHRIKNILATVQAIAAQTMRSASSGEREAFFARLDALAGAHGLLTNENWHQAPVSDIVGRALKAFQEKHRERFVIDGHDGVWLDAKKSLTLTMVLHELATNAVKYGALSNGIGWVRVTWQLLRTAQPTRLQVRWQESGGPPVKPPQQKGFGSLVIERALESELGTAQFDFDPQGLACALELPF